MLGKDAIFHCSDFNQALYDSFMTVSSIKVLCVFHSSTTSAFSLSMTENKLKWRVWYIHAIGEPFKVPLVDVVVIIMIINENV